MSEDRHSLLDVKTGVTRPAIPRLPVLSSDRQRWPEITLEQYAGGPVEMIDLAPQGHVILLQLENTREGEWQHSSGRSHSAPVQSGQICILPAMSSFSTTTPDTGVFLAAELDPKFLLRTAHELIHPEGFELAAQFGIDDPLLRGLLLALKTEMSADPPGATAYVTAIATTVAMHLVRHYSARQRAISTSGQRLSRPQSVRVLEFMNEHLAEDISLHTLAAVVEMSPYHFARLFKRTIGLAPHQYLIRRRLERAKDLLQAGKRTIADVAVEVGFCDQSHLAAHFKRVYGLTPRAFLQQTQPRKVPL